MLNFFFLSAAAEKENYDTYLYHSSNLVNFSIPNIPNPVPWSAQVAESHGTMQIPQIKNVTFFPVFSVLDSNIVIYSLYSISRFLV